MQGRVVIQSESGNLQVIDALVKELQSCVQISEEDVFKTRLVLSEAIQNAITHGNHNDPEKTVIIDYSYDLTKEELSFCISDQGPGFDLSSVLDPTLPDNVGREGGRGVYFLKRFTDGLSYCNEAKAIRFSLKIPSQA